MSGLGTLLGANATYWRAGESGNSDLAPVDGEVPGRAVRSGERAVPDILGRLVAGGEGREVGVGEIGLVLESTSPWTSSGPATPYLGGLIQED
jgi:hypothetical protein